MTITLNTEQQEWIAAHVARGEFASTEDAVRQLLDAGIAGHELDADDDFAWAKPYVEEACAAVARGEVSSLDEYKTHTAALLAALKG